MSADYLKITYNDDPHQNDTNAPGILSFCDSEIYTKPIINYRKLTSGNDVKDVYECTIDLSDITHKLIPGDAIGILPNNDTHEVDLLMDLLNIKANYYKLSILENTTKKKPVIPSHIPSNGSIIHLLKECLDVRSVPKKAFLKMLAQHTTNQEEKDELLKLSNPKEGKYNTFIANEGRSLLTILRKFPSCKPPLECLLEHLPQLKPRFYSISSKTTDSISIAFSVIELFDRNDTQSDEMLKGVCSSYLESVLLDDTKQSMIRFYFRQPTNFLHFDEEFNSPLILIGPGTGIAPFRGLLQELEKKPHKCDVYLFFGCRFSNRDFLYKAELDRFVECGVLKKMFTAFSREGKEKVYVQNKLVENGELIANLLLNDNAYLRLCGDANNLTKAVDQALKDILGEFGGLDIGECDDFLKEMKMLGRYRIDSWL